MNPVQNPMEEQNRLLYFTKIVPKGVLGMVEKKKEKKKKTRRM